MENVSQTIIFDLDGTLADINHRRVHLEKENPDWKAFNNEMANDTPNAPIVDLYNTLWDSNHYELIIVTGRMEDRRDVTEEWLNTYKIPFERVIMRAEKDFRSDHEIKQEILEALLAENKKIVLAIDDRQQVVDMWRKNGITCLQCDEGNF